MRFEIFVGEQVSPDIFSYAPFFVSLIAVSISLWVVLRGNKKERNQGTNAFQSSMQVFNQAVLNDDDLIQYDRLLHPFGDLSEPEIKKVYFWFLAFNVSYAAVQSSSHKSMRSKLAKSSLANIANLSFGDRNFIEEHVFPRGYDDEFAQEFRDFWITIDESNMTLPMFGTLVDSGVEPRRSIGSQRGEEAPDFFAEVEESIEAHHKSEKAKKSRMVTAPVSNGATKKNSPVTSSNS